MRFAALFLIPGNIQSLKSCLVYAREFKKLTSLLTALAL